MKKCAPNFIKTVKEFLQIYLYFVFHVFLIKKYPKKNLYQATLKIKNNKRIVGGQEFGFSNFK